MDTARICAIFEYEFQRGANVVQTTLNTNDVYGADATNELTARFWFARITLTPVKMLT